MQSKRFPCTVAVSPIPKRRFGIDEHFRIDWKEETSSVRFRDYSLLRAFRRASCICDALAQRELLARNKCATRQDGQHPTAGITVARRAVLFNNAQSVLGHRDKYEIQDRACSPRNSFATTGSKPSSKGLRQDMFLNAYGSCSKGGGMIWSFAPSGARVTWTSPLDFGAQKGYCATCC